MLRNVLSRVAFQVGRGSSHPHPVGEGPKTRRLAVESLEDRRLLSVAPVGPVREVDTTSTNQQYSPSTAMADNGDYAVVWEESGNIYGRRFNANGTAKAGTFTVNYSSTGDNSYDPDISMANDGSFVVTWTEYDDPDGTDPESTTIKCRAYDASGSTTLFETTVPTTDAVDKTQNRAAVSMSSTGHRFLVVWTHQYDSSDYDVRRRTFYRGGSWSADLNDHGVATSGDLEDYSDVAMDSAGNYVVTWEREGYDGGDSDRDIFCAGWNSTGTLQFSEKRVNTTDGGNSQYDPKVAMPDGGGWFVVAWDH